MKIYTKKQIVELIPSLTLRQVQFYTEEGVVTPLEAKPGTGNARLYSEENLREFAVIGHLAKLGMTISVIKKVIEAKPFSIEKIPDSIKNDKDYFKKKLNCDLDFKFNYDYSLFIFFNKGELQQVVPLPNISFIQGKDKPMLLHIIENFVFGDFIANRINVNLEYDAVIFCNVSKLIENL